MDTQSVKSLTTQGQGSFYLTDYTIPELGPTQILVKSILTGICSSDVDMMQGKFAVLPENMMGHEGLGQVTAVGSNVTDVAVGQYVATRGEPAYAEYYVANARTYVQVPSAEPKYILEPVACGINVIRQNITQLKPLANNLNRCAIIGSGFVAYCAYQTMLHYGLSFQYDFIGSHNQDVWLNQKPELDGKYSVVIDFSNKLDVFEQDCLKTNALVILAANKSGQINLERLLWNNATVSFPSPRSDRFYESMIASRHLVEQGRIDSARFWTQGYKFEDYQQAFDAAVNREPGYNRGYLIYA